MSENEFSLLSTVVPGIDSEIDCLDLDPISITDYLCGLDMLLSQFLQLEKGDNSIFLMKVS